MIEHMGMYRIEAVLIRMDGLGWNIYWLSNANFLSFEALLIQTCEI